MPEFLRRLFSADGFMPHGHCYFWNPEVVWLHVTSDGLIAASYMTIPFTLTWFIRRRRDLPFPFVFWAFGLFIVSCGMTHVMEIWTLWNPTYWLSGLIKAVTAATSVTTAVVLVRLLPEALKIPSPALLREAHDRLAATEARFRAATEQMKDAFYIFDSVKEGGDVVNLRLVEVNAAGVSRLGMAREEMMGKLYTEVYPRARESGVLDRFIRIVNTGEPYDDELKVNEASQPVRWVHLRAVSLGGGIAVTSTDITERRKSERERELHTAVVKNMSEGLSLVRQSDGVFVYTNLKLDRMLGYGAGELQGEPASKVQDPSDASASPAMIARRIRELGETTYEVRNLCKDGRSITCQATASVIRHEDHGELLVTVQGDITELRRSYAEREVLLKEIHHRVKNNLQVISSLLKLHAEQVIDPIARIAFHDSQDRVRSIGLLHEQLYQSNSLAEVDIGAYAEALIHTLLRANARGEVELTIDGAGVSLPMDSAVPFGLILNELVTNCLKHGFADGQVSEPRLEVKMESTASDLELVVTDNGPGFPVGAEPTKSKTLGMHLILALASQLDGTVRFESAGGARSRLRFPNPTRRDTQ